LLLAYAGYRDAPTEIEIAHLPAGLSHWQSGSYYYFRQNPPLVRLVASLPILAMSPSVDWSAFSQDPALRPELVSGKGFLLANRPRSAWLFTVARWACIPFSLLGAWICFRMSYDLFGGAAGLIAMTVWCFSPMILGHGHLINPDVAAASLGIAAIHVTLRWVRGQSYSSAAIAGLVCGLAMLTKLTWVVLPCVVVVVCAVHMLSSRGARIVSAATTVRQLAMLLTLAVVTVNAVYNFEGTGRRLGDYALISGRMTGNPPSENPEPGNRFRDTIMSALPLPLPRYYIEGIDVQAADFERPWDSYLGGTWKHGGWSYYYAYAALVKTPSGTLALAILALIAFVMAPRCRADVTSEVALALPIVVVSLLCASQSNMSVHYRYLIPAYPFFYVWISRLGVVWTSSKTRQSCAVRASVVVAIGTLVVGSLGCYPYSLSFFNLLAGGPTNGHRHLLGSSLDWGQDALRLGEWQKCDQDRNNLKVALGSYASPEDFGFHGTIIEDRPPGTRLFHPSDITPGWYAIGLTPLFGMNPLFACFRQLRPEARIGYSINVYHVSVPEASAMRAAAQAIQDLRASLAKFARREEPVRVAIVAFDKAELWTLRSFVDRTGHDPLLSFECLTPSKVHDGALRARAYHVVVVFGGSAADKAQALQEHGLDELRAFVLSGGGYVGICGGAYLATTGYGLNLVNEQAMNGKDPERDGDLAVLADRGAAELTIQVTPIGSHVFPEAPSKLKLPYTSGPVLCEWARHLPSPVVSLADFAEEVWRLPSQKNTMSGTPAIVAAKHGKGSVILFSPHPDFRPESTVLLLHAIKAVAHSGE
jgi:hypothetical protein